MTTTTKLLTTKELADLTGFSPSFFEKGRAYGYGPAYVKLRGAVRYRFEDFDAWLQSERVVPGGEDYA